MVYELNIREFLSLKTIGFLVNAFLTYADFFPMLIYIVRTSHNLTRDLSLRSDII